MSSQGTYASGTLDALHLCLALGLFLLNVLLWRIVSKGEFAGRLKYIGQEMVFLSLGIVAARIFVMNLVAVLLTILLYILVWAITLFLTQQVIDYKGKTLYPQLVGTILIGLLSVYLSATGYLEHLIAMSLQGLKR